VSVHRAIASATETSIRNHKVPNRTLCLSSFPLCQSTEIGSFWRPLTGTITYYDTEQSQLSVLRSSGCPCRLKQHQVFSHVKIEEFERGLRNEVEAGETEEDFEFLRSSLLSDEQNKVLKKRLQRIKQCVLGRSEFRLKRYHFSSLES
jgi:hypothetical protein